MTRQPWTRQRCLTTALLPVLMTAGLLSLYQLEDRASAAENQERLYFPSGKFLREVSCGFQEMAADFLWFETVQYYGGYRMGENDLRYFDVLIDSVTELDPRFFEVYYFASLVKGLDFGKIDEAIELLRKGILHNPDNASLHFNIGFMYYVFNKDYPRASVWFDAAARTPTATDFVRRFAAYAKKRAGQLEASIALWENIRRTASNPEMTDLAERMIVRCQELIEQRQAAGQDGTR